MTEVAEVKTIGDVERIVHGSGMWDGTGPVEFSNDGDRWVEAWAPTEDHPHPEFARVQVHRKDVTIPKRKTIRWDDYVPRGEGERSIFWLAQWTASPSRHFDRITRMVNYREMFRDIIGDIVIEGEDVDHEPAPKPEAPARDWFFDIATSMDTDELDAVVAEAKNAVAFTADAAGTRLDRAHKLRRRELTSVLALDVTGSALTIVADMAKIRKDLAADQWEPAPGPSENAKGPATPERIAELNEMDARPRPQDHLPGNRASRRAKKKRGRR